MLCWQICNTYQDQSRVFLEPGQLLAISSSIWNYTVVGTQHIIVFFPRVPSQVSGSTNSLFIELAQRKKKPIDLPFFLATTLLGMIKIASRQTLTRAFVVMTAPLVEMGEKKRSGSLVCPLLASKAVWWSTNTSWGCSCALDEELR